MSIGSPLSPNLNRYPLGVQTFPTRSFTVCRSVCCRARAHPPRLRERVSERGATARRGTGEHRSSPPVTRFRGGSLPPGDPPPSPAPPPRPIKPEEKQALNVLWKRPSRPGPSPIAREPAAGISVVGKGTVFRVLPGSAAFAKKSSRSSALCEALSLPHSRRTLPSCPVGRFASPRSPDCKRHQAFAGLDGI